MKMEFNNLYLLWFANEYVNFRLSEIESILKVHNLDMKWIDQPREQPFLVVEFNSEEDALKFASRSFSLHSLIKLWGYGDTVEELHKNVKSYPKDLSMPYLSSNVSFRVEVVTFGRTFTMKEKVAKMETFNYLPANGPVRLKDPDVKFFYIEYYGLSKKTEKPESCYFGVWLTDGQRSFISKYSLKTRKFIGNTSMDPQLSFFMANQALIKKGDLVMDPFVGTGSVLVAAAHFGGYVIGVDIDYLMLHGKTRPSRIQDRCRAKDESIYANLKQYNTGSQYIDVVVGDSSLPFWSRRLELDSIITDPPYGIREANEKIGSTREYKISEHHLEGHIPSKIKYSLSQIFIDLLNFSVRHLKIKGRLVAWLPVVKETYVETMLPHHPCLRLVSNCEQSLSDHASRRLLTWEKVREIRSAEDKPNVPTIFPIEFRQLFFGSGETRKQRKMRIAQELKEKGLQYLPRKRHENSNR